MAIRQSDHLYYLFLAKACRDHCAILSDIENRRAVNHGVNKTQASGGLRVVTGAGHIRCHFCAIHAGLPTDFL